MEKRQITKLELNCHSEYNDHGNSIPKLAQKSNLTCYPINLKGKPTIWIKYRNYSQSCRWRETPLRPWFVPNRLLWYFSSRENGTRGAQGIEALPSRFYFFPFLFSQKTNGYESASATAWIGLSKLLMIKDHKKMIKGSLCKKCLFHHCYRPGCGSSFGIEKIDSVGYQMTASSGTASDGRLYNPRGAWCADVRSNVEYIQVNLKGTATVRGLATQGHPTARQWTRAFAIKYSHDKLEWLKFNDNQSSWKVWVTKLLIFSLGTNKNWYKSKLCGTHRRHPPPPPLPHCFCL